MKKQGGHERRIGFGTVLDVWSRTDSEAAIAWAKGTDHAGNVQVVPMRHFDLNKTIFSTLEGRLPRMVMEAKIANHVYWDDTSAREIESAYQQVSKGQPVPTVDAKLLEFMLEECDFSMEHADGTFLEHLMFCHEYAAKHFPAYSPVVLLLHSILGTGTNTFAMEASKIPKLKELLTDFEALHIEAFPSIFRLLYDLRLLTVLDTNLARLSQLESVTFHRVIDNKPLTLDAENFWIQLNFQLIHFIEFLPPANWSSHAADPLLQSFKELSDFLNRAHQRMAKVEFEMPQTSREVVGEKRTLGGKISAIIPPSLKKQLAAKSIRKFSKKIGHSLDFELKWKP